MREREDERLWWFDDIGQVSLFDSPLDLSRRYTIPSLFSGAGSVHAFGILNSLRLFNVIELASLAFDMLCALMMNIVDLDDMIGHMSIVVVSVIYHTNGMYVMTIHVCNDGLVELSVVIVLANDVSRIVVR